MKHLIAYVGVRSGGLYKVLTAKKAIFDIQDLKLGKSYTPTYKLEDDEWFFIDKFKDRGYNNAFIDKKTNSTTTLNQLEEKKYPKIKYLCCQENNLKYFQKVLPSNIISKKWFAISNAPVLEDNKKIIYLSNIPDAIYDTKADKLYFRDISRIKVIFKNIDELYREATQVEINDFLKQDFIELTNDYSSSNVKVRNRKRIALVVEQLKKFTQAEKKKIFDYIHKYCKEVPFNEGKFSISTEEDLKLVLFGIDERYYTTNLSKEKRLANSIIPI